MNASQQKTWSRPRRNDDGPQRTAGGFYRLADNDEIGRRSVPLTETEDAIVAAVRMAYGVASAQVERSSRLAQRLRKAGDNATGGRSDRKAVDATEQLVFRTMMSALSWIEGLAAEGDSPLKRLVIAQYRLLGSALGLSVTTVADDPPLAEAAAHAAATALAESSEPRTRQLDMAVVFAGAVRRPVHARRLQMATARPFQGEVELFHGEARDPLKGHLAINDQGAIIRLRIERDTAPGRWSAAVCDDDGVQVGIAEIEL